jgi:hypothetical protein
MEFECASLTASFVYARLTAIQHAICAARFTAWSAKLRRTNLMDFVTWAGFVHHIFAWTVPYRWT